jgi:hypothetical protein
MSTNAACPVPNSVKKRYCVVSEELNKRENCIKCCYNCLLSCDNRCAVSESVKLQPKLTGR